MDDNRRRFTRISTDNTAEVVIGKKKYTIEIHDMSLKGLLINETADVDMPIGLQVKIYWHLSEEFDGLIINGKVVWQKSACIGIKFTTLPAETVKQLYRFLELNLGDEDLFDRELEQLFQSVDTI